MESIGKVNRYVCEKCKAVHGTINLNTGVTPFLIRCKSEACDGMAQSSIYRLPPGETSCGWAWYRPTAAEFHRLERATQEHVLSGGLILGDLSEVVNLREDGEAYEAVSGGDGERWLCYAVAAYQPDVELLHAVSERMGGHK